MIAARSRLDFNLRAALVWEVISDAETPLSIGEIGGRAGLTRSPYLRTMVDTLLAHGYIQKGLDAGKRGHAVIVYWAVKAPDWLSVDNP